MVGVFADKDIWAVLDSGCNTACHGEVWARNAQTNLADLGFDLPWVDAFGKRFAGLTALSHSHGENNTSRRAPS